MSDWLCANRLSLNTGKIEFIVFRPQRYKITEKVTLQMHHSELFESSKIKYLGLILDNKLDWKGHITELSKKLSRAIGLLYKIRNLCPLYYSILIHICYMDLLSGVMLIVRILIKLNLSESEHLDVLFLQTMIKNNDTNSIYFDLIIFNRDH